MIVAMIPAKSDSTRLPGKNMLDLLGKPLLYYAIECAKESKLISDIYVTTDSDETSNYAKQEGIKVIKRPKSLGGDIPLFDVYKHALKSIDLKEIETVVGVQPDHPDRKISLDESIRRFKSESLDFLYSVDGKGDKNGAQCVVKASCIMTGVVNNKDFIVDDCTNIHYLEDLELAKSRLRNKNQQG